VLVSGSQDKTAKVWSISDAKVTAEFKGHTDIVDAVAFSPDGKTVASGSADKSVKLWNPKDGKEIKSLGVHTGSVYAVAFSPDGKVLASASADKTAKIWDVVGQKELKQLIGNDEAVTGVTFAGDADTVVTASMDRTIRVWSVKAVKDIKTLKKDPPKTDPPKKDAKVDPKDKKDTKDKKDPPKVEEPKIDPKDLGEVKRLGPTSDDPYALVWSADTKTLAVIGYSGQITTWALDNEKPKLTKAIKSPGYCIAFTKDGKAVLTGHDNGTVSLTALDGK
jgi:WD40 repeat protein